jgi:hypothetical protein
MHALQLAHAFAELGDGHFFEHAHDAFAHFFHDAANAAFLFIGTGAAFVKTFAHTADWGQRSVDQADDFSDADLIGRTSQAVAAGDAALAFENAGGAKFVQNLFEKTFGNVLGGGNGLDAHDGIAFVHAEDNQSAQSIMAPLRELHAKNSRSDVDLVKFVKITAA